jgi:uncharacterized protein
MTDRVHPHILEHLKRADGNLHRIIAMIEEDHPCYELARQLQAVETRSTMPRKR